MRLRNLSPYYLSGSGSGWLSVSTLDVRWLYLISLGTHHVLKYCGSAGRVWAWLSRIGRDRVLDRVLVSLLFMKLTWLVHVNWFVKVSIQKYSAPKYCCNITQYPQVPRSIIPLRRPSYEANPCRSTRRSSRIFTTYLPSIRCCVL